MGHLSRDTTAGLFYATDSRCQSHRQPFQCHHGNVITPYARSCHLYGCDHDGDRSYYPCSNNMGFDINRPKQTALLLLPLCLLGPLTHHVCHQTVRLWIHYMSQTDVLRDKDSNYMVLKIPFKPCATTRLLALERRQQEEKLVTVVAATVACGGSDYNLLVH